MKGYIKKLLREGLLSEVTDEIYELIEREYSSSRILMSKNDEIQFRPVDQSSTPRHKPMGLWYGIGTSWLDWVRGEMPEWEAENVFLLDINESKIIKITNDEELLAFNDKYSEKNTYGGSFLTGDAPINWVKVAEHYDGIEIAPYLWNMRMDDRVGWYYTWDVASGCIWGSGVIKKIERIN
jgi:hypothetical protein